MLAGPCASNCLEIFIQVFHAMQLVFNLVHFIQEMKAMKPIY